MRKRWNSKGGPLFAIFAGFAYVFMMQALFSLIINAASLYVILHSTKKEYSQITLIDILGSVVFSVGLIFEAVGDH